MGDFALLLRRYSVLKKTPSVAQVVNDLEAECSFRGQNRSREIGFTAKY